MQDTTQLTIIVKLYNIETTILNPGKELSWEFP